ncbi:hypothetical protein COZ13_03520 [Candidatus Desantisbacteria bacterium CG_4_10_14_3_um_filter_40_18]|uniref:Uncharacterized protein n=1 Tax=Candidatus Desantisbacteria bacterium CG_4_10_14_3_um_filter_40_18 TaxID=1974544 RepID=A0A2M7P2B8_9BACT|nr:MAG: hypothetical protein COZ13_03520 [Candidatus Desantisbacteria bacterium CG_4_10_14_3_um_filter_40_18]
MNKIFIIFVVLLTHLSLCYGENIDGDKLELSPQYEEGTTTSTTEENEMMGTESSDIGSPTVESKQEAVSSQQGTESSSVGSSTVDQPINPSTYQPINHRDHPLSAPLPSQASHLNLRLPPPLK